MNTTITVKPNTRRMLEMIKEKKKSKTFDDLLSNWAHKELKMPKSLAGAFPGLDTKNVRDHIDRSERY